VKNVKIYVLPADHKTRQKQYSKAFEAIFSQTAVFFLYLSFAYFKSNILLVPRSRSALKESQQGETLHCLLFLILRRYKALKGQRWVYVPKTRESG
jgi:hypothetical protein